MYKIRRFIIPEIYSLHRCYGSNRNQPNHYETLCIKKNSSQKEIRDAFLKLSKELHPDIGSKGSHEEFVKLNEAYNILSKDWSRQQHDVDLKRQSSSTRYKESYRYSNGMSHHDPVDFESQTNNANSQSGENNRGIQGTKRVSKAKIVALCILVGLSLFSLEMMFLRYSIQRNQKYLHNRSLQAERDYMEIRAMANSMTKEERLEAMQKRFVAENERRI